MGEALLEVKGGKRGGAALGERPRLASEQRGAYAAFLISLSAHHKDTGLHVQRVARLSKRLGREMGLSSAELVTLYVGCALHDLGKIGVSRHILDKTERLTEEEWKAMREHPVTGAQMIGSLYSEGILRAVAEHHEWVDGTGYPAGLRASEISLEARICAVIDAYDAMTSDRAYRQSLPYAVAMHEIQTGSGSQFDADIVEAFGRIPRQELVH